MINKCCDELEETVLEGCTFQTFVHTPFDVKDKHPEKLYILDDGGHGGFYICSYCPFCGKEVTFEAQ